MRTYAFQDEAYRDNAKRNRERGGSTVRCFRTSEAVWKNQGGFIPTEQEIAEWNERYERDVMAENAALDEHWHEMNMMGTKKVGAEVGAPAPVTSPNHARPARKSRGREMSPKEYIQICEKLGITLTDMAELLAISRRQSSRYANGETAIPVLHATILRLLDDGLITIDDVL